MLTQALDNSMLSDMKEETKEKVVALRVTDKEHTEIKQAAKENGFDSMTAYILWLYRKYGRKQE